MLRKPDEVDDFDVFLFKNGAMIAKIALMDELRPQSKELILALRKQGIEPVLLSGDRTETCSAFAKELDIKEVYSEQLPEDKLNRIEEISRRGKTAMVGDGINDAPALSKAHIGVSLGGATDIAIQSAQVVLLKGDIGSILSLLQIGKHTMLTIRQNLFWAFFYNIFAIPLAAFGFLNPMLAVVAMACSDVVVIGNSIRLNYKRID